MSWNTQSKASMVQRAIVVLLGVLIISPLCSESAERLDSSEPQIYIYIFSRWYGDQSP